jgi:hypothetical protein
MELDDSVEKRLREAYCGAISKDPDRISRALDGITPQETATFVDLGLYVSGYIVNEIFQHSPTDDNVRELADRIGARESDWTQTGDADTIVRFLDAAVTGDTTRVGLGAADLTRLVIVCGGHLLAYHRPDGQRWYEYLDEICAPLNPCSDTTIGRPDSPTTELAVSDRATRPAQSYVPSQLVSDIAMALPGWGFEVHMLADNIVQAHQSAWNLLTILGLRPDPGTCPCLACGGAERHLSALDFEAAIDPQLTGLPNAAASAQNRTAPPARCAHLKDRPPPAPYPPSRLVCDVMMILIQRGFEVSLHSKDLVQAHQSARILLSTLGQVPDTDRCPCQDCGGPAIHLTQYDFVAGDDPAPLPLAEEPKEEQP